MVAFWLRNMAINQARLGRDFNRDWVAIVDGDLENDRDSIRHLPGEKNEWFYRWKIKQIRRWQDRF